MRALTVEVLDQGVGGVGFEGDAVVAVDYVAVGYGDVRAAVDVPARAVISGVFATGSREKITRLKRNY